MFIGRYIQLFIVAVLVTKNVVRYTGIQEFPNLNRCAKAGRINGRVKLLASRPIHKTNRVSTHTFENDRCK
jgi:hypothetical protein